MYSTLETQGNIRILTTMNRVNRRPRTKRLDKDTYVHLGTGEVREYKHQDNRTGNKKSLYRTFNKIRGLINANAEHPRRLKWITLTYREVMTDTDRLRTDFDSFWKRLVRHFAKKGIPKPEYITVVEPQGENHGNTWHHHLLLIFPKTAPFIANEDIERIWGHGFTKTRGVGNKDNLGAYLSAYLTDIAIEKTEGVPTKKTENGKKSIVKGGRLHCYPPGMNIYRCSRGVKRPVKRTVSQREADEIRRTSNETFAHITDYVDPKSNFKTTIIKEYFNDKPRRNRRDIQRRDGEDRQGAR